MNTNVATHKQSFGVCRSVWEGYTCREILQMAYDRDGCAVPLGKARWTFGDKPQGRLHGLMYATRGGR